MSNLFKRKLNTSLGGPWMEAQVQGVFLGALSIMRKSERNARLGWKVRGHAGVLPVGSAGSSGLPAPRCYWEHPR